MKFSNKKYLKIVGFNLLFICMKSDKRNGNFFIFENLVRKCKENDVKWLFVFKCKQECLNSTVIAGAYPGGRTPGGPSESLILAPSGLKNVALIPPP